eukprot:gene9257-19216_t
MDHDISRQNAEVSGYLFKRRGGFGKHMPNCWQQRFFTVKEGALYYFEDDEDNKPRGKLDLKSGMFSFFVGTPIENSPTVFTMQLIPTPGIEHEKWKLCAETKEDLHKWSVCIEKHVSSAPPLSPGKFPLPTDDDDDDIGKYSGMRPKARSVMLDSSSPLLKTMRTASTSRTNDTITGLKTNTQLQSINNNTTTLSQHKEIASGSISFASSTINSPTPIVTTTTSKTVILPAHKPKKRLKLNVNSESQSDTMETTMVVIIMNISFVMAWTSSFPIAIFYLTIANIVVGRTLWLRALRTCAIAANSNEDKSLISSDSKIILSSNSKNSSTNIIKSSSNNNVGKLSSSSAISTGGDGDGVTAGIDGVGVVTGGHIRVPGELPVAVFTQPPNVPDHTWNKCDHRQFNVRVGPDYNRYKKKAASGPPIYEAVAVDVFCTKLRVDYIASKIQLPDASDIDTHNTFVPAIFVVQIQIPSEPPPLFGSVEDGPGWAIVMYFKLTQEASSQLKDLSTAPPALRLFNQWCEKAPVDAAWRGRFKVINSCLNLEELGMPQMILNYNAKPVLIRRTGSINRGKGHMEMDIHVHKFAAVAKRSIHLLSSRCGLMYMQIGFVIE